ncbi:MAG: hypothetical protein JW734_08465 [Candidatus Omnitrophica bacterium]|nr:hypothetical protein [Candidatus Omnitrophota bacterium]
MPKRKSRFLFYVFKIFVIVLGVIISLEILIRSFLFLSLKIYFKKNIPQPYRTRVEKLLLSPGEKALSKTFDPICFFLWEGYGKGVFFRGPKGITGCAEKEPDEIRIMCLGDSTTYCGALPYEESWPYLIEQTLRKEYPDQNIKVLNAGMPGSFAKQMKRMFQFHLVKFEPDIVLWREQGSQWVDTYNVNVGVSYIRGLLWRILFESRIFRVICVLIDGNKKWQATAADFIYYYLSGERDSHKEEGFTSNFDIVVKIAQEHGINHVLAIDYTDMDDEFTNYADIEGFKGPVLWSNYLEHRERNQPVVVTYHIFKEEIEKNGFKDIFYDGHHLTVKGSRILAEETAKFLTDNGWIEELKK